LMTLPYMYESAEIQESLAHYREALVAAGHAPATREILGKFHVYVAESNEAAYREAAPYLERYEASAASVIRRPSHQVARSAGRRRGRVGGASGVGGEGGVAARLVLLVGAAGDGDGAHHVAALDDGHGAAARRDAAVAGDDQALEPRLPGRARELLRGLLEAG